MPPRLPGALRTIIPQPKNTYVCPSCLLNAERRRSSRNFNTSTLHWPQAAKRPQRVSNTALTTHVDLPACQVQVISQRRYANGLLASATATNASSTLHPEYRELQQQLLALQAQASGYVDLARIELALRGLESSEPTTRIAFLGLGKSGTRKARELARVLLSDALGKEEEWERQILAATEDGGNLLLQYGEPDDATHSSPLVRNVRLPSRFLQRNRVEILILSLNSLAGSSARTDGTQLQDAILVPSLTTPSSAGGRVGFVRYPVHKAVVIAEGAAGAIELGWLSSILEPSKLISLVLALPLRPPRQSEVEVTKTGMTIVDIESANDALDLFRKDIANGAQFSSQWQASHMPVISNWIAGEQTSGLKTLNSSISSLISSTLQNTASVVEISSAQARTMAETKTVPEGRREELHQAIRDWATSAHSDLQNNLASALQSRSWRRTTWWRLFWRLDDISIYFSDILRRSWLTEAEQSLAFLSGRISQAGLATDEQLKESGIKTLIDDVNKASMVEYEAKKAKIETLAEFWRMPSLIAETQRQTGINALFDPPWPQTIHMNREYLINTVVPNLHIKAQELLFSGLSIIGGSVALGTWLYIASAGLALDESGAIVALGLVWSLRRLQKRWTKDRSDFAKTLEDDGRKVLRDLESRLSKLVSTGGGAQVKPEDEMEWRKVRTAIQQCQEALDRLTKTP